MFRATLALLLIANLVACPLRCISCETRAAGGQDSAPSTCSCCSHEDDAPASPSPIDRSGTDCSCKNCICEGAVLESDPEPGNRAGAAVESVHRLTIFTLDTVPGILGDHRARKDRGLYLSGRDVRIAHQSWLI